MPQQQKSRAVKKKASPFIRVEWDLIFNLNYVIYIIFFSREYHHICKIKMSYHRFLSIFQTKSTYRLIIT